MKCVAIKGEKEFEVKEIDCLAKEFDPEFEQAISTENNRLIKVNNEMVILANQIELYKIETSAKLAEMMDRYAQLQKSWDSGNAYIDSCQEFIDKNS